MLPNVTMIVDLSFGSTGKGLIAGYLSETGEFDTVISANNPNAGHTAYDHKGVKFIHKAMPSGIFSGSVKRVMIGPGAVFSPEVLEKEVSHAMVAGWLVGVEILIHGQSVPLTPQMKIDEENSPVTGIASTAQGGLFAQFAKMQRDKTKKVIARDAYVPSLHLPIRVITNAEWLDVIYYDAKNILAEGAQGHSLGINNDFYPYVTSRPCDPSRFMSDMALPHKALKKVIGVMRTFPIRVGDTNMGTSGGCYPDQHETSWEDIGQLPETTTVTGRTRRVFTPSKMQLQESLATVCPDEIFINFLQYLTPYPGAVDFVRSVEEVAKEYGSVVKYIGMGPKSCDIVVVK